MNGYIWGGAVAGLLVIAALGVLLAQRGAALRRNLEPYVGRGVAKGLLVGAWVAYGYGALHACTAVATIYQSLGADHTPPAVVAFVLGFVERSLLPAVNAALSVLHLVVLLTAAVMLYRHLKVEAS